MASESLFVVLSGTPEEVREGYRDELAMLIRDPLARVLIIQAPWPPRRLRAGWSEFMQAVAQHPAFEPVRQPWIQPGTHVLAHAVLSVGQPGAQLPK